MALSNTYDTTNPGSGVGNREDLSDGVDLLAPQNTPVYSLAAKTKATATFHEWVVDTLATPSTTAVPEGADITQYTDKFANRARLGNYVQTVRRDFMVSNLQQAVSSVGPANIAQAELKAVKELKRDVEAVFCGTQDRAAEDGSGTANTTRGLGDWIDSSGPSDVPSSYRTPSDSIYASTAFTETIMNTIITSIYRQNGEVNDLTLVADTALRRAVSGFTLSSGSATASQRIINEDAGARTLTLSVEMYQSDNGNVAVVNMNPVCAPDTTNKDTGYFINSAFLECADLIPMGSQRAPNLGGGDRGWVDYTFAVVCKHPGAFGKITQIA
jgi:hypothetical protein